MESTLSSIYYASDPSLTQLDSPHHMIWWSGQTALFLFLEKSVLASLPTALSVALRPLLFSRPSMFKFFLLKPAPFCKLFSGLGSTNKFATFLLLSGFRSVFFSVFPFTLVSLAETVFFLLLFYQAAMGPWEMMQLMSRPDGEHYLCPLQSLYFLLLLRITTATD